MIKLLRDVDNEYCQGKAGDVLDNLPRVVQTLLVVRGQAVRYDGKKKEAATNKRRQAPANKRKGGAK